MTTLESGGQAHLENPLDNIQIKAQGAKVHMEEPFVPHQAQQHQCSRDVLGDDGGQGHAVHTHVETQHKGQGQHHIDDTGHCEEVQGAAGVSLRPQDCRAEVIEHVGGHTAEINAKIQSRQINDVGRRGHPHQHLPAEGDARYHQQNTA